MEHRGRIGAAAPIVRDQSSEVWIAPIDELARRIDESKPGQTLVIDFEG